MESNLTLQQGANNGWFIYKDGRLLAGSHDEQIANKILLFLQNEGKCSHTPEERIGETKLWCCNICGQRIENF